MLFLGSYKFDVCFGPFSKIDAPTRLPMPTKLPLQRHHSLCAYISGLEGTLLKSTHCLLEYDVT
jgi:hypothetical protein